MRDHAGDLLDVVHGEHGRAAVARGGLDRADEQLTGGQVEPGGRLVEQEELGVGDERPRDQDPLPLARRAVAERPAGQLGAADELEQRPGAAPIRRRRLLEPGLQRPGRPRHDELLHQDRGTDPVGEHVRDVTDPAAEATDVDPTEAFAEYPHLASGRLTPRAGELEQRGLAAAVRPEHDPVLPAPDDEVHRPEDPAAADRHLGATKGEGLHAGGRYQRDPAPCVWKSRDGRPCTRRFPFPRKTPSRYAPLGMRTQASRAADLDPSTRRILWASGGAMLFVAVVAATPGSPFLAVLPVGYEPSGPLRWVSNLLGLDRLSVAWLLLVGLLATAAAAAGFVLVLREAWRGRLPLRTVLALAAAYHAAVLMLPLLFSRDVYSYAYYGRIFSTYGDNPYVFVPNDYPLNSLFDLTWPGWRATPSVYGPLFTWVSALLTSTVKSIPSLITGFQVLAAAASLATAWLVARTARRIRPERAVFAAAIVGLNPIVVFHVVGGGHNDSLVALFVALAVASLFAGRRLAAAIALALGMAVKATAAVPLVLLVVAAVAAAPPGRRRRELAILGGAVAGLWLLLAWPFLQGTNPTLGLLDVAGNDSWMAPGQLVLHLASALGRLLNGPAGAEVGALIARVGLYGMSAACVGLIAREIWRRPEARTPTALAAAWGWALLVVILPSPVLFTWYLVWAFPLAWLLPKAPRRGLVLLSTFFIVTHLVTESARLPEFMQQLRFPFGHPIAIAVLVWIGRDFWLRVRSGTLLHVETPGRAFADVLEAPAAPRALRPVPSLGPELVPSAAVSEPAVRRGAGGRPRTTLERIAASHTMRRLM